MTEKYDPVQLERRGKEATMKLRDNTVVITGGGTGIGYALAERFVQAGSRVIICGRRAGILREAQELCPQLETYQVNVEDNAERLRMFRELTDSYPDINVLVNNAGIQIHPPRLTKEQVWQRHEQEISINLEAPIHLSMLFTQHLASKERSAIVNVTSGLAFVPLAFVPTYSATKAGLHSFTQSLRFQLKDTSIEVYEVAPPAVDTDLGGPGKHTFGVNVDDFADHVMSKFAAGIQEFGYETSELSRTASYDERSTLFWKMNLAMQDRFPE
jgi:uncharacterized oxidoreductase